MSINYDNDTFPKQNTPQKVMANQALPFCSTRKYYWGGEERIRSDFSAAILFTSGQPEQSGGLAIA